MITLELLVRLPVSSPLHLDKHHFSLDNALMACFSALPVEVADGILRGFCLFCGPRHYEGCDLYGDGDALRGCHCRGLDRRSRDRVTTLSSLCLTSRALNSLATRHLYHFLNCEEQWWLLAATLLARPDLAQFVRELSVHRPSRVTRPRCAPEVVAFFNDQFRIFSAAMLEAGETVNPALLEDGHRFSRSDNVPLDILLPLCPRLSRLDASLWYADAFRFLRPRSLPRLQRVSLSHGDDESGFSFDKIARLFRAAPDITHMCFWSINRCRHVEPGCLAKVTSLDLECSAFGYSDLVKILSACPNLETLKYEMGGSMVGVEQFDLCEIRKAVLAHAPKLKHLQLRTGEDDDLHEHWEEDEVGVLERALAKRGISLDFQRRKYED